MNFRELPFFRTFRPSPTAVAIEPTAGPWTNSPNWGNTFVGTIPLAERTVVSVVETSELPGSPQVHVVNLFRSDQVFTGTTNAQVRARITYGIGAKQNEFDCDWLQGQQFALVANYVRVNFVTYAPNGDSPYDAVPGVSGTPGVITLGAGIARGNAAKHHPLSFTYPSRFISADPAPADRYIVTPTDFAQALVLHANSTAGVAPVAGDIEVQFRSTGSEITAIYDGAFIRNNYGAAGLRLPGGTQEVRIFRTGGAPGTGFRVTPQFILGL